jgi:hypothetical protein
MRGPRQDLMDMPGERIRPAPDGRSGGKHDDPERERRGRPESSRSGGIPAFRPGRPEALQRPKDLSAAQPQRRGRFTRGQPARLNISQYTDPPRFPEMNISNLPTGGIFILRLQDKRRTPDSGKSGRVTI